jgi:hypothetical protein
MIQAGPPGAIIGTSSVIPAQDLPNTIHRPAAAVRWTVPPARLQSVNLTRLKTGQNWGGGGGEKNRN